MIGGDLVGKRIGHYQVEQALAEGGMARVYVASDANTGRRVAIKALLPELGNNPDLAQRFMNEARAMGKIHHPGVVDVFDVLVGPSGELCIIMELINGRNLREHIEAFGPMTPAQAVPVMRGIADALSAAHALGIVHRDLKPENIILVTDALGEVRPKVLDFGIAKIADANNVQTATGSTMGTATYMAPEQFRSAKDVDHRADIYALGCLFFELLAGRPPFNGRNLFEQMTAHLQQPPPFELLPPTTQPAVLSMIQRMLAKERDQRLGSLTEAMAILDGRAPAHGGPYGQGPAHAHGSQAHGAQAHGPHSHGPHSHGPHGHPSQHPQPTAVVTSQRAGGSNSWIIALVAIILVAAGVAVALALT
jgi:serine/threonine-protein kinase